MVQQSLVDLNNLRMYVNITVQSMVQEGVATVEHTANAASATATGAMKNTILYI